MLAAAATSGTGQSRIVFAASKYTGDMDFREGCVQSFDANWLPGGGMTNYYAWEPRIGTSRDDIIVTADMFGSDDSQFKYSKVWVLRKSDLYNGYQQDCPALGTRAINWGFTNADGSLAKSLVPVHSYTNSPITSMVNSVAPGDTGANTVTYLASGYERHQRGYVQPDSSDNGAVHQRAGGHAGGDDRDDWHRG